jgi:hypothetical protein
MTQVLTAFADLYDKDINNRIFDGIGQMPTEWQAYTIFGPTPNYVENDTNYSGFGAIGQWPDGEDLPVDEALKIGKETVTQVFYGMGFKVSRKFIRYGDANLQKFQRWADSLVKSGGQTISLTHANILNNGFTTTFSHFGSSAKALFSDTHTTSSATTRDNLGAAAALTPATWETLRVLAMNWVNYRGLRDPFVINKMIVPPALRKVAEQILGSSKEPFTTDNEKNIHLGTATLVVDPFLSSSTAYFGQADGHGINSRWGLAPQPLRYMVDSSQALVHGISFDFVMSVKHPDGMVASAGA